MSNNAKPQAAARGGKSMPTLERALSGRRILLTGSTGFLGKTFLYVLLRHHPEVERIYLLIRGDRRAALSRYQREVADSAAMDPLRAEMGPRFQRYLEDRIVVLPGDISQEGLLAADSDPLRRGQIDAVVHCAGLVNFEASLEKALVANTLGVINVIEFCRKLGARLLHVSTCYVAGGADGHRYEEDIPADWCPDDRQTQFNVRREIRDARAAIERIEAASREQANYAEFSESADGEPHEAMSEGRRKRWVEEKLKQEGLARAQRWGWPNTYSYTKSMGEQLVLGARGELDVTVVRPAVIESAIADPAPGWNQGVNTSAPLTYLSGEGFRFYPARPDLVLDVIPVDLVAHAMVPVMAALISGRHEPIYQLGTSECNPLPMRRLVELTALANREYQRDGRGTMGKLAPHLEAVIVSREAYDFISLAAPEFIKQAVGFAKSAARLEPGRTRRFDKRLDGFLDQVGIARSLVSVYLPYIQDLVYTFHCRNIRALYARMTPADARRHPFAPEKIDWRDYWINIHIPGLRRHIFPQLDLHTRGRVRAARRHRNLVELLETAASRFGAGAALVAHHQSGEQTTLSYRETRDRAARAGLMLAGRGVRPGDRVLLIGENSPDWVVAFFAILYAGAVAVPLDNMVSAEELAAICRIAEPRAALLSDTVHRRLTKTIGELGSDIAQFEFDELARPFLLRAGAPPKPEIDRKALAAIFFTSGSTGTPKGVMLTHANLTAEVSMLSRVFSLNQDEVLLSLLPLHHTFEFTCGMLMPMASGSKIVYPLGVDAANLSSTLAQIRPTALIGVPALWQAIHRRILDEVESRGAVLHSVFDRLRDLNRRLSSDVGLNLGPLLFRPAHQALGGRLRLAVSGGAALPNRVAEFFNDIGLRLLEGYGLTEAAPVLSVAHPDEPLIAGSVGKPLVGVELKLNTENGDLVGEILAHGPNVMAGYYRDQAATDAALKEGWLQTGDLGRFDEQGRLYIVGRAKDVIVDAGGNNVYIDEVEEAYGHSTYLKELAVVGLKTPGGEQVAALVVPAYARGQSRRAVHDQLQAHFAKVGAALNPHKRIRILRFTDSDLPRTRTRKIKRAEVAELLGRMIAQSSEERHTEVDVEPWLVETLSQVTADGANISSATRLIEDLGLDSLALAELGEHVAERTGRELSPEELGNLRTVEDLQQAIAQGSKRPRLPSYAHLAEPYTPQLPAVLRRLGEAATRGAQRTLLSRWLKPRVMGRGNIPANRNVVVVANHCSHVDFAVVRDALGAAGRRLVVLAASDYFFNTPLRRFVAHNFSPLIPFDRERAQLESLDQALALLADGRSVLMFPEGTRSTDGTLQEFKSGAGYLALRSGCDVLPIHISGTHQVLGKGSVVPRYHQVEVRIGGVIGNQRLRDIAESGDGAGAYRSVSDFLRRTVAGLPLGHKSFKERADTKPQEPVRRVRHQRQEHAQARQT
jgi:long-chain acyl-CoA synthetase